MLQRTIVLRRFQREPVEVVCLELPAAAPALVAGPGCKVSSYADGDTQVYSVMLPDGYVVRPVDWRRFALDEPKMRELLSHCVRDNLAEAVFEPWSSTLADRVLPPLKLALQDLSSMLDVVDVQIEPGDQRDELRVSVAVLDVCGANSNVVIALSGDSMAPRLLKIEDVADMPDYLAPGVYVEEIGRGPRPIEGVPTSTAAFIGETERGPLRPRLVTSYKEYQRWFGETLADDRYLPHAVWGFFENGGRRLYVARIVGDGASTASSNCGDFVVTAIGPGAWGRRVWARIEDGSTADAQGRRGFRLKLAYWSNLPGNFEPYDPFEAANLAKQPRPQQTEMYDNLSVDPMSSDYYETRLFDASTNAPVSAIALIARRQGQGTRPANTVAAGVFLDQGGADDAAPLGVDDFTGAVAGIRGELSGLEALKLDAYREVALVYAPRPPNDPDPIAREIVAHCEQRRYRFAVIDGPRDEQPGVLDPRTTLQDTQYAAFYAPWITVTDPGTGAARLVPPGGHVLGVYARTDVERGVWKAPANEIVRGALDVGFVVDDAMQGLMNPRGVNAIREFPGRGIRVWGARTLSSDQQWRYVSVRRLFLFLERSIDVGTQWVVFEPNDERLWVTVTDTIRLFLRNQWRGGALLGQTEDEAFYIRCDRTTMTQDDIVNGRLICEIGIAAVRPAEFVIFRLLQRTAEVQA
jgi:phage tail sheath protein FI